MSILSIECAWQGKQGARVEQKAKNQRLAKWHQAL